MSMRTIQVMHVHEVKHDQDCVCVHCLLYEYIYTYLRISTFLDYFFFLMLELFHHWCLIVNIHNQSQVIMIN